MDGSLENMTEARDVDRLDVRALKDKLQGFLWWQRISAKLHQLIVSRNSNTVANSTVVKQSLDIGEIVALAFETGHSGYNCWVLSVDWRSGLDVERGMRALRLVAPAVLVRPTLSIQTGGCIGRWGWLGVENRRRVEEVGGYAIYFAESS
jgi:hypothetical protein